MRGSTGTNTGTIIYVKRKKKKKSRPCNCKKCKHARVVDHVANCMLTGEIQVKKRTCPYYFKSRES